MRTAILSHRRMVAYSTDCLAGGLEVERIQRSWSTRQRAIAHRSDTSSTIAKIHHLLKKLVLLAVVDLMKYTIPCGAMPSTWIPALDTPQAQRCLEEPKKFCTSEGVPQPTLLVISSCITLMLPFHDNPGLGGGTKLPKMALSANAM